MARYEHQREDLLREATALVPRVALQADDERVVVIGFRRDGCGSLYLGDDLAYHFNGKNALRRAYIEGELFKAEHGRLVALRRERTADEVQLLRRTLGPADEAQCLRRLAGEIEQLRRHLRSGNLRIMGQVPEQGDVLERVRQWLDQLGGDIPIAARPHAQ